MRSTVPPPQASLIPSFPAARTVPGASAVRSSKTAVENTLHRVPPKKVAAAGHGISPRT